MALPVGVESRMRGENEIYEAIRSLMEDIESGLIEDKVEEAYMMFTVNTLRWVLGLKSLYTVE